MSEFVQSPSSSSVVGVRGTKPNNNTMSTGVVPMSTMTPRRRSVSAGVGPRNPVPQSVPAGGGGGLSYSTPQPPRRNSNPTGSSSSGFYSYSPSDSRTQSLELKCRRYSQPSSTSPFAGTAASSADYLIRQEKESYSSLSFLPEVQTYLHFMEDTGTQHHRSNSFHGRNSIGPGGHRKMRTRSQSRSPAATGGAGAREEEYEETCFIESPPQKPSTSNPKRAPEHYGQYLAASKSASIDTAAVQVHPPPVTTMRRMSLGGGETARTTTGSRRSPTISMRPIKTAAVPNPCPGQQGSPDELTEQREETGGPGEDGEDDDDDDEMQNGPVFRRCFERRRSSTIRTSFI